MAQKDPDQALLLPSTLDDGLELKANTDDLIHLESIATSCSSGFSPDQHQRQRKERKEQKQERVNDISDHFENQQSGQQSGSMNDYLISEVYRDYSNELEIYKKEISQEGSKVDVENAMKKSEKNCHQIEHPEDEIQEEEEEEEQKVQVQKDEQDEHDESMSTVSAITFEYSNLGPPESGSTTSYSPQQYITNLSTKMTTAPHHNKSTRLSGVHEKVITIQKENKNLKEANLRLMLQVSSSSSKQKKLNQKRISIGTVPKIDDETSRRLGKIYGKVQEVQKENMDLKRENLILRSQLESRIPIPSVQSSHSFPASYMAMSASSDIEPRGGGNLGRNYSMEVNTGLYPSPSIEERIKIGTGTPTTTTVTTETPDRSILTTGAIVSMPTDASTNIAAPTPVTKNTSKNLISLSIKEQQENHHVESNSNNEYATKINHQNSCPIFESEGNVVPSPSSLSLPTYATGTQQSNKENAIGKKKRRGLGLGPILNRSDKRIEEMNQKIGNLEDRLHKSKSMRSQDIEKIAELEAENIQQRTLIMSLERQVKQSNSIVANLEQQVDNARNEIADLKEMHNFEKEELQLAYEELKEETANLVNWLKTQLSEYQGKSKYAEEIARAQDEEDLESLTPSEKEALTKEIEEERKNWLKVIEGYDENNCPRSQRSISSNGNGSIGASTLTTRSSI